MAPTPTGWPAGDEQCRADQRVPLADILAAELSSAEQSGLTAGPPARTWARWRGPPAPGVRGQDPAGAPAGHRAARGGAHRAGPSTAELAEAEQLKETVAQLERALTVRVRVEQAIGILAERHRIRPRQAFELLRSASRARGQRIMETASQVIASATNPLLRLPEELAKPPMPRRLPRRSRGEA